MVHFSDEDDDDDDEDDTEALMAELEQIKKERAEEKLRKVSFFLLSYISGLSHAAILP